MRLQDAINSLVNEHVDDKNDWYSWKRINENKLPLGIILSDGNQYEKNVELKKKLHKKWLCADINDRKTLIKYYIGTWGGIYGNSNATIDEYNNSCDTKLICNGSNGIASWSKALCVHDPNLYGIFDARVSASLNSLQKIYDVEDKILYPILPSRNNTIIKGNKYFKVLGWNRANENDFYHVYLSHLKNVGIDVYTTEMLLFAKAEELVERALMK